MKTTLGTIVGYLAWTIFWLGGNALLKKTGVTPDETSVPIHGGQALCALLALSVVCSLTAGFIAQTVSRATSFYLAAVLGSLLLVTGLAVQLSMLHLMPLWYHVLFLALLVPVTFAGTRVAPRLSGAIQP